MKFVIFFAALIISVLGCELSRDYEQNHAYEQVRAYEQFRNDKRARDYERFRNDEQFRTDMQKLFEDTFMETVNDPDFDSWARKESATLKTWDDFINGIVAHLPKHVMAVLEDEKTIDAFKTDFALLLTMVVVMLGETAESAEIKSSFKGTGLESDNSKAFGDSHHESSKFKTLTTHERRYK